MGNKRGAKPFNIELLVERERIPETWYEDILDIGRQGKAEISIVNYMGISWNTYQRLKDRCPKFLKAVNTAKKLSEEWWVEIARQQWLDGKSKSINSNHWSLMVRNMFGDRWSDRKETDITSKGDKITDNTISVEIIRNIQDEDESNT